jgi:hypothetical protein
MATEKLKDANYRTIGFINTGANGTKTLKNANYKVLGHYEPKQNVTKDASHRVVGHGNLLTRLLSR